MNKTNIAWTDYTWNPVTGCIAVSDGCKNCYAKTVHERFNKDIPFSEIVFHENRLSAPYKKKKSKMIFVGSMTDLFQNDVTYEMFEKILVTVTGNPQHIFQILTKRPKRMRKFFERYCKVFEVPKNLWLGVTCENQKEADARIPILLATPASKRFISTEPMIREVDLTEIKYHDKTMNNCWDVLMGKTGCNYLPKTMGDNFSYNINEEDIYPQYHNYPRGYYDANIDWVIVGGESGAKSKCREMNPAWVQKIYDDCKANKVPFFFKQWGSHKPKDVGSYEFENVQEFPVIIKE